MELDSKRWTTSIAKHTQSVLSRCFFSMQFPNVNYFRQQCPFPSLRLRSGHAFPKACPESVEGRGLNLTEKIPPLKRGIKGIKGDLSSTSTSRRRLDFLIELLVDHARKLWS